MFKFFSVGVVVAAMVFFTDAVTDLLDTSTVYRDALSRECIAVESVRGVEECPQERAALPPGAPVYVEPGMTYEKFTRRFEK